MFESFSVNRFIGVNYYLKLSRTYGLHFMAAWAHRITGVLLFIYVLLHMFTLANLSNPKAFEAKMQLYASVIPAFVEWLLAVPVIYHALNGGRLILYEMFGNRDEDRLLRWTVGLSSAYIILLGIFMVMGNQTVSAVFFWVYVVTVSALITYVTFSRSRHSGASLFWKMQRISGAFLFLAIPAHMLFMHLDPSIGRDSVLIIARMNNLFIKMVDVLLVVCVLYHGAYGIIEMSKEYIMLRGPQMVFKFCILLVSVVSAFLGLRLIVFI